MTSAERVEGLTDLFAKLDPASDPFTAAVIAQQGGAVYPEFSGEIGPTMTYRGRPCLIWNVNNYLGLASHPEVRRADAENAARWGLAAPMGARMMSGESQELRALEAEVAEHAGKPEALFLNYGYQGMVSLIDALVGRDDTILYDDSCHACILDGVRLHRGRRFSFPHNNVDRLEQLLTQTSRRGRGGVLVVTEGVFGMSGTRGRLDLIARLRDRYGFRLLVDDAHGFGVLGPAGAGTAAAAGVQDSIDLHFGTFAKAGASVGAFVAGATQVLGSLRHRLRSQTFSKGLPTAIIAGNRTRLRLIRRLDERRERLCAVARSLQRGLTDNGFDVGGTDTPITPVYFDMSVADAVHFTDRLRDEHDIYCSFVVHPVVPRGVVQLRIVPTALHTEADAERTVSALVAVRG